MKLLTREKREIEMSRDESDRVLTAIEHYTNQLRIEIENAHKKKIYLDWDHKWRLHQDLNKLADALGEYDTENKLYEEEIDESS